MLPSSFSTMSPRPISRQLFPASPSSPPRPSRFSRQASVFTHYPPQFEFPTVYHDHGRYSRPTPAPLMPTPALPFACYPVPGAAAAAVAAVTPPDRRRSGVLVHSASPSIGLAAALDGDTTPPCARSDFSDDLSVENSSPRLRKARRLDLEEESESSSSSSSTSSASSEDEEEEDYNSIRPQSKAELLYAIMTTRKNLFFFVQPFASMPMVMKMKFPPTDEQIADLLSRGFEYAEFLREKKRFRNMAFRYSLPCSVRASRLLSLAMHRLSTIEAALEYDRQLDAEAERIRLRGIRLARGEVVESDEEEKEEETPKRRPFTLASLISDSDSMTDSSSSSASSPVPILEEDEEEEEEEEDDHDDDRDQEDDYDADVESGVDDGEDTTDSDNSYDDDDSE